MLETILKRLLVITDKTADSLTKYKATEQDLNAMGLVKCKKCNIWVGVEFINNDGFCC